MASKITIYRGTTYPVVYKHQNAAGVAQDLTGTTLYFTVKPVVEDDSQDDSTAVIKKTVTSHSDPTNGLSGFTLTDVDTYITPGKYHFDFLVEDASGKTDPPSVFGDFIVKGHPGNRQTLNG
jgi:hypothetical protein